MTKLKDLKARLLKDPQVRKHYDALEEEFALMEAVAKARARSGLGQAELAKRMKTTQSTIARLESGRGRPSNSHARPLRQGHGAPAENRIRAGAQEGMIGQRVGRISQRRNPPTSNTNGGLRGANPPYGLGAGTFIR